MRGDKFTNVPISSSKTKDAPGRLEFDGKKYISAVIKNTSLSAQNLWVGVNSDELIEPLAPGESFPIAAREGAYLRGYLAYGWTDQVATRTGIITMGVDEGEIEEC